MSVALVRILIADPETHDRALAAGDGATVEFRLPQSPVVANSQAVSVGGVPKSEGVDYTILDEPGVVTFVAPPPAPVDPDVPNVVIAYRHTLLSDATLQEILTLEGHVKLAAASALDVIASSEALVLKKIELLDLKTDGPAVARALREHAKALREQVAAADLIADAGAFDVAELVVDEFAARERLAKQAVRTW